MKKLTLFDLFDQRRLPSHIFFLILALVVTLSIGFIRRSTINYFDLVLTFIVMLLQIEIFVYMGNLLFSKVNFDQSPGVVTRVVLIRFLIFLAGCLFGSMIIYLMVKYVIGIINEEDLASVIPGFFSDEWHVWFRSTAKGLSIGAAIFVVLLWQTSLRREQMLREKNLIFQNETLKNQVNPHFLFNSLNTISSLVQSEPEAAERFINNLSAIYRYILENVQKDSVPLRSELDFLTDFYSLHRTRDEEKILLSVEAPGAERFRILPVSLQILLENAIKHNIATRENPLIITVKIEDQYITVRNNLQKKGMQLNSTRTGLKNLAERSRLITGKDLVIEEDAHFFTVKLPLLK